MAKIDSCTIRDSVLSIVKSSDLFNKLSEDNPEIKIYDNAVSQNLFDGCFFVKSISLPIRHVLGNVYQHSERVEVRYFISGDEAEDITLMMIRELCGLMEYISIDGQYFRGREMESNVTDRVLHFYTTFQFRVEKEEDPADKMGTLDVETKLG